jgi:LPS-assembly protein
MSMRKPLPTQQTQTTLTTKRTKLAYAIGILASLPLAPIAAAEMQSQWNCSPSNGGWSCSESLTQEPAYQRPYHSTKKALIALEKKPEIFSKSRELPAAEVDWVEAELLTEEQQQVSASGCCGKYVEPTREDPDAEMNPDEAALNASAASSEMQQDSTAQLKGEVRLTQGYRVLEADSAILNQAESIANLDGNIRLREPGLLLTGSSAEIHTDTGNATITDATYLLHESGIRGEAKVLRHNSDKTLVMQDASYTQCEPGNNLWNFRSSTLTIDPNAQQGYGKHVRLNIKGVPVFYTPYIQFPLGDERQSGFLFPSISSSGSGGFDIATPYYFNLAPNYDMTLTPRFISEHGEMLELEARHMSKNTKNDISFGYLADDKGGDDSDLQDFVDSNDSNALERFYKGEDRWLIDVNHIGNYDSGLYSSIDYTRVSDIDYFRDLSTASLEVNSATHLKEKGVFGYRSEHWDSSIELEQYQTIASDTLSPYQQLPQINIDGQYRLADHWVVELDNEITRFEHRDEFYDNSTDPLITGDRVFLDYSLGWEQEWTWGFIKPAVTVKSLSYQLEDDRFNNNTNDSPSITVPQASLDMGLYFERDGSIFGNGYTQTFEPRLFYFYSEYENHDELFNLTSGAGSRANVDFDTSEYTFSYSQLFRDSRFSGHDRIGDDNRLSVGLTSRFIETSTGIERFSASIGQIYYYDDRLVDLTLTSAQAALDPDNLEDTSEMAMALSGRIGDYWQLSSDLIVDEDDNNKVTRGNMSLRYSDDDYRLFNISYRYVRQAGAADTFDIDNDGDTTELFDNDIEQADLSFAWPISKSWSLVGRYNQDITNSRQLDTLIGVEYNDCCYKLRVIARTWLDNALYTVVDDTLLEEDTGIFFEFQFKGLGSLGSKVSTILSDSIYGYDSEQQNSNF